MCGCTNFKCADEAQRFAHRITFEHPYIKNDPSSLITPKYRRYGWQVFDFQV